MKAARDPASGGTTWVETGGLRFHCRVDGLAGAPWLVFSNSLLTNLSLWDGQVEALAKTHRILRYDQRGHGATGIPAYSSTFDLLVDDAVSLLDHFGIERAAFVGVSMGGVTGLRLAIRHPERLSGLVACDAQWRAGDTSIDVWNERLALASSHGISALVEPTIRRWFTPAFVESGAPALDRVRLMIAGTTFAGAASCIRALQRYDFSDDLAGIRVPCLLVAGEADGPVPAVMREMHGAVPGSRFVEIADAGHLPNVERPDEFNRLLQGFLTGPARARE